MSHTVNLIALSKPSAISDCYSAEQLIAYMARVSNPANQNNPETGTKLLKYLIKNKHWSPFEMVHLTMEIKTTRDISRQILRHRSFSFQEFSQRYAVSEEFINNREARLQDNKNRQNSVETSDKALQMNWELCQKGALEHAQAAYDWALKNGIAKEQARAVLPEGLTKTTLYMAGSLRSWIHYVALRGGNGTQKEHREIALKCKDIILQHFPSLEGLIDEE
jgi:thymidylate synthase (FAD)